LNPVVASGRGQRVKTELSHRNIGIPGGLTLKSEGGWQSLRKVALGQDILTGDDAFDALINVGKDEATALAVLDATARARVISFVRGWEGSTAAVRRWLADLEPIGALEEEGLRVTAFARGSGDSARLAARPKSASPPPCAQRRGRSERGREA
jgi:hypothetical protein